MTTYDFRDDYNQSPKLHGVFHSVAVQFRFAKLLVFFASVLLSGRWFSFLQTVCLFLHELRASLQKPGVGKSCSRYSGPQGEVSGGLSALRNFKEG